MSDIIQTNQISFEDFGNDNGIRFWYARDLMVFLGYADFKAFSKVISKAMAVCPALDIPNHENFISIERTLDGVAIDDFKLTRFACYLTAMNADSRKQQVAAAQFYFANLAVTFQKYIQTGEAVERVAIREEMSDRERSLSGVANKAGVHDYALFKNAGYRGMYNMNLGELKNRKGVDSNKSLLDFMGKQELAANLFRITQTEAKIKNEQIHGQGSLEVTAEEVGREVRNTMLKISGMAPENLPIADDIKLVKKDLKTTHKEFKKLDASKSNKKNK